MTLKSINPATGTLISEFEETSRETAELRLQMAGDSFRVWRKTPFEERAERFLRLAEILRSEKEQLAALVTREMGKPIRQAEAEVEKCALNCEFYAKHGDVYLAEEPADIEGARAYVRYDPLGPILAIMPWNFPLWQVFRCAVPTIIAGNVFVLKHASNVCGVALEIENLFTRADFPAGVFNTLLLTSQHAEELIGHPVIQAVTLTGSERAGQAIAAAAGKALKPSVMELGGSDPFIVLCDADLKHAAEQAARARTQNTGQSCIAAKRFLVETPVVREFERELVAAMERLHVGDPAQRETDVGPLARDDLRESLHDQVLRSLQAGAQLLTGGESLPGKGFFYRPTVLGDVAPGMPAFDEETFGPVAAVIPVEDAAHAVDVANHSRYGLGASIWTSNRALAEALAPELEAGSVFINEIVKSDPRLPFGGVKHSGYGRELARQGVREFVNTKTIWIQ